MQFGGLLRGTYDDGDAVRVEAEALRALLPIPIDVEIERGRYTLRFDDRVLSAKECPEFDGPRVVEGLQRILDAGNDPAGSESTLRFVQVFQNEVAEVGLLLEGGEVRQLGRVRPIASEDHERIAEIQHRQRSAQRRLLHLTLLGLVGAAVLAVALRIPDRLLGPAPSEITLDLGDYDGELEVELESRYGALLAVLRRTEASEKDVQNVRIELRSDEKLLQHSLLRIDDEEHAVGEPIEVPFAPFRTATRLRLTAP